MEKIDEEIDTTEGIINKEEKNPDTHQKFKIYSGMGKGIYAINTDQLNELSF